MSRRRKHSIHKRRQRMTSILLKHVAIVHHSALGDGEVRSTDIRWERVVLLDEYSATAITKLRHHWAVLSCVMTDDKAMHINRVTVSAPLLQEELTDTLREQHEQLLAEVKILIALEGKGVQVHSCGWIAMPVQQDLEDEKAERLFAAALKTMRRAAA